MGSILFSAEIGGPHAANQGAWCSVLIYGFAKEEDPPVLIHQDLVGGWSQV